MSDVAARTVQHLVATQDFGPDLGGIARYLVELCRHLAPDGVSVSTVAPRAGAFDDGEPYEICRQPFPFGMAKTAANQIRWARSLVRQSRRVGADVLHSANLRPTGLAVWLAHERTSLPYVIHVYGGDLLKERRKGRGDPLRRWSARRVLGNAAAVIANSRWTADLAGDVMAELGVTSPPPVVVVSPGVDPSRFSPARATGQLRARFGLGDAPVLLTVARLVRHKGQDVALAAVAALRNDFPTLRYLVVGAGPDTETLSRLAEQLGVADRVVFAGVLDDAELADAYATATLYLGLSRVESETDAEGFGLAFVEAAASGIPSVAGDSGGVRSAVRDGETALVVPPTDVGAAAAAVRALLADPGRRAAMGRTGREVVVASQTWQRVAGDIRGVVRRVIADRAPAAAGRRLSPTRSP